MDDTKVEKYITKDGKATVIFHGSPDRKAMESAAEKFIKNAIRNGSI